MSHSENPELEGGERWEFFLIVAPGLEVIAQRELAFWVPNAQPVVERGGITVHLPLAEGLQLNRCLKTVTRILLRMTSFGCRDFPKLFKKLSAFAWRDWLEDEVEVEFHASAHRSRLFVKKRIESTCIDARRAYLGQGKTGQGKTGQGKTGQGKTGQGKTGEGKTAAKKNQTAPLAKVDVFVRIIDDVCTLSLDTSGELLHKRGHRELSSEAPLRETIAAALLLLLEGHNASDKDIVGNRIELVDPMTGGGTFLIEAAMLRKPIYGRSFAFEACAPLLARAQSQQKQYISDQPPQRQSDQLRPEVSRKNINSFEYSSFVGLDLDSHALESARGNLLSLDPILSQEKQIKLICGDIFQASDLSKNLIGSHLSDRDQPDRKLPEENVSDGKVSKMGLKRWLIANPPYGERIRVKGKLSDYYESLFAACETFAQPERACFLLPEKVSPMKLRAPSAWQRVEALRFSNGGLPVVALIFKRR